MLAKSRFTDLHTASSEFKADVLRGFSGPVKQISPKYLYDRRGSKLFERICEVEAYYPTRAEHEILKNGCREMAALMGRHVLLIEPGAGNGAKVKYLLDVMEAPDAYVPVEISRDALLPMTNVLQKRYPKLEIHPVCADYTKHLELPASLEGRGQKRVAFFPGSTLGNFDPEEAKAFLERLGKLVGPQGGVLLGVDLKKDRATLERAYDDPEGVTAAFNLNLLMRINRELQANFVLSRFAHRATYNEAIGRIEMHLVSAQDQIVRVAGQSFRFRRGESIHTESSYKYSGEEIAKLAGSAGFRLVRTWTDGRGRFADYYLERTNPSLRLS
ncbi:MAG: L-histidine N(alpha)-methyltransferase [Proteobacteria bacterium]|nr:MAG: L-histidine N(alpha)-methyltransferase [Pseudomonadota bacterium]